MIFQTQYCVLYFLMYLTEKMFFLFEKCVFFKLDNQSDHYIIRSLEINNG